jgi:hypothetical protein
MSESDADPRSDPSADAEYGYTEWRCENCGHTAPKNNPPCSRCGNMRFEQVYVSEGDFDDVSAPSTLELIRENPRPVVAGLAILVVAALVGAASVGAVVLADPLGLGYRYGAVDAVPADGDGTLTTAEFHGRVADEVAGGDTSLQWYGRTLELSYVSSADSNEALVAELTEVGVLYAEYVADGGDAARLRVTADIADGGRARVFVSSADATAFANGELSRGQFQSRILDSAG